MSVFEHYSKYYDLLYSAKNYQEEAEYIHRLIQQNFPGAKSILNLGCGTGKHDLAFERLGYEVVGIDLSDQMVQIANSNKSDNSKVQFYQGDIRDIRLNQKFDIVVSLFHVMCYQVENSDLIAVFETARIHLKDEGVFIFDFWYGPSVLMDPPAIRVKRIGNNEIDILRLAEPIHNLDNNTVDVLYEIRVKDKQTDSEHIINEKHSIRYLFLPEIYAFGQDFKSIGSYKWLTYEKPDSSWFAISVLKYFSKRSKKV